MLINQLDRYKQNNRYIIGDNTCLKKLTLIKFSLNLHLFIKNFPRSHCSLTVSVLSNCISLRTDGLIL